MLFYENSNSSKAVTTAANECIEENILADFLRKNKAEAIEMCLFEYDEKREKELIRKAEFQEGVKDATKRMIQALQLIQKKCWKHYMSIHNRLLYLL